MAEEVAGVEPQLVDAVRPLRQSGVPAGQEVGQHRRGAAADQLPGADLGAHPQLPVAEAAVAPGRALDLDQVGHPVAVGRPGDAGERQAVGDRHLDGVRIGALLAAAEPGAHGVAVAAVGPAGVEPFDILDRLGVGPHAVAVDVVIVRRRARAGLPGEGHVALVLEHGRDQDGRRQRLGGDGDRHRGLAVVAGAVVRLEQQLVGAVERQAPPRGEQVVFDRRHVHAEDLERAVAAAPPGQAPGFEVGVERAADHVERLAEHRAVGRIGGSRPRAGCCRRSSRMRVSTVRSKRVGSLEPQGIGPVGQLAGVPVEVDRPIGQFAAGRRHHGAGCPRNLPARALRPARRRRPTRAGSLR